MCCRTVKLLLRMGGVPVTMFDAEAVVASYLVDARAGQAVDDDMK
jgi:hypothetical protein